MNLSGLQWTTVGFTIVGNFIFSIGLGWYLDTKYKTSPKFILIFLALAVASVFLTFWRINSRLNKRGKDEIK